MIAKLVLLEVMTRFSHVRRVAVADFLTCTDAGASCHHLSTPVRLARPTDGPATCSALIAAFALSRGIPSLGASPLPYLPSLLRLDRL